MKLKISFTLYYCFFILLIITTSELQIKQTNLLNSEQSKDINQNEGSFHLIEPDKELEIIRKYMKDYASELVKSTNIYIKKINNGILPEEYPEKIRQKARKSRYDHSKWDPIMLYPTALWRTCIYPTFKINYTTWCRHTFGVTQSKLRLNGCLNNYCNVCCGNLPYIYRDITNKHSIPVKLGLSKQRGLLALKSIIRPEESEQCRAECNKQYPIDLPIILPTPPRDPGLGKSVNNPANSCSDIKKWGDERAKNGIYWVELLSKGIIKVYCDMESEGGGWTLFINYKHLPGQDLSLDSSKIPSSLEENSHINLGEAGFSTKDVKEIRFKCYEKLGLETSYWHFKTTNKEMISTSLTGDQQELTKESLSSNYQELDPIKGYKRKVYTELINNFDYIGFNSNGGFIDTPFGSNDFEMYWTIRGNSKENPKYECASKHEYIGGYSSPDTNPNMVESHHMVFFRGEAPSPKMVRARLFNRVG